MNRDILEVSGSSVGTVLNATPIEATDAGRFNSVLVQLIGTWTGTIIFEASNDGTTWYSNPMMKVDSQGYFATVTSNSLCYGLITGRYFRARVSSGGTGTVQAKALFSIRPVVQQHGVVPVGSTGSSCVITAPQDNFSDATSLWTFSCTALYNPGGSKWDRQRANHEATVLASTARTASVNSSDLTNYNAAGVTLTIDVTAVTDTPSITVAIKYKDTLSGKYVTLLESVAITATGTYTLRVYPGCVAVANQVANAPLPRVWRVEVTNANADSITYSISANYNN
jgi:hypothetical protein